MVHFELSHKIVSYKTCLSSDIGLPDVSSSMAAARTLSSTSPASAVAVVPGGPTVGSSLTGGGARYLLDRERIEPLVTL